MKELKLGVIGSGGRGKITADIHKKEEGVRMIAACDKAADMRDKARKDFGDDCLVTDDYRKVLDLDLDGVFICTPDFLHEEHAAAALERGIGVYLEKPMAITVEGCDRLMEIAKNAGAKLFVGHNMRYMTIIRKMKKLIDDGAIGEVKSVWCRHFISYGGDAYFHDWHADRRCSTGLLLQKGAHDIDVIHWLCGAYSRRVSAFGNLAVYGDLPRRKEGESFRVNEINNTDNWPPRALKDFNPHIDIEDQTVMIMEMEKGIMGAYLQCHFAPDSCRNYTFIGTEGRLENIGHRPEDPIILWNRRTDGYSIFGNETHYGDKLQVSGGHGGSDTIIMREFFDYLRGDVDRTTATPQAARMAVAAGYQATMSLRSGGGALEVPELRKDLCCHVF